MSHAQKDHLYRIVRVLGLAALMGTVVASVGCGGALSNSNNQTQTDPLHLGAAPGPLGTTINPQPIQVRLGSEPSDRIVSLSLTLNSLQATNSGNGDIDLLTDPVTVEFTRIALVTEPISIKTIYQDTYSALVFPEMTGQVAFYDVNGQLVSQSLTVPGRTVPFNFALGSNPLVLSVSLDLAQTFATTNTTVTVNPLVVTAETAVPDPISVEPEKGSISFLVGSVTSANSSNPISLQPASGDSMQVAYDGNTQFVNCSPSTLQGYIVNVKGATQADGTVLAAKIERIDNSQTGSELYGLMTGFAPQGMYYNLVADGGIGLNVANTLLGKNITIDWTGAGYSVNGANLDLSRSDDLVFDESRAFPGQMVEVAWDALVVPDPDSSNFGFMQPGMFELEQQTLSGTVTGYTYDETLQAHTFVLNVAGNAPIKIMNPGLISITVRQTSQTYLRNEPTFVDGDPVKVRGLLFADPNYNSVDYVSDPPNPVKFIMVASRISK